VLNVLKKSSDALAARARGCWWHEVDAAGGEGVAAEQAPHSERRAVKHAMSAQCLGCVAGARGVEAAAGVGAGERVEQRGDEELVEFYEEKKGGGAEWKRRLAAFRKAEGRRFHFGGLGVVVDVFCFGHVAVSIFERCDGMRR